MFNLMLIFKILSKKNLSSVSNILLAKIYLKIGKGPQPLKERMKQSL